MIWVFSDIYWPAVSGVPVTIDYLVSALVEVGYAVGMVTVGARSSVSELAAIHVTPRTGDSVAFQGDQVAFFSAYSLARTIPSSPTDLFIIATPGRVGLTGLGIARRRRRPAIMLYLTDVLRYARYYPAARPTMYAMPKALFLFAGAMRHPAVRSRCPASGDRANRTAPLRSEHFPWSLKRSVRLLYSCATAVVVLSEKSAIDLTDIVRLPSDRVRRIASGFCVPDAWRTVPARPVVGTTRRHELRLLYVGRLAPEKCIENLLSALAVSRRYGAPVTLTLVGGGHGEAALRDQVEALDLEAAVTFRGVVPREDLGPLYAEADLLAFPSTSDTQGLVMLEAAWFGLPSLIVDRDASELARVGAAFVTAGATAFDLAAEIIYLWRNPKALASVARELPGLVDWMLTGTTVEWLDLVARLGNGA